jgi:hypothetical protein
MTSPSEYRAETRSVNDYFLSENSCGPISFMNFCTLLDAHNGAKSNFLCIIVFFAEQQQNDSLLRFVSGANSASSPFDLAGEWNVARRIDSSQIQQSEVKSNTVAGSTLFFIEVIKV